jgi:hypothetical protein
MAAVDRGSAHWPEGTVHFEAFQPPEGDDTPPEPFTIMHRFLLRPIRQRSRRCARRA